MESAEHERIVVGFRPHWWALVRPLIMVVVTLLVCWGAVRLLPGGAFFDFVKLAIVAQGVKAVLLLALVLLPRWIIARHTLTDHRLVVRPGILTRSRREIPLAGIARVLLRQSRLQRLLGTGTLIVEADAKRARTVLKNIARAERVRDELLARTGEPAVGVPS